MQKLWIIASAAALFATAVSADSYTNGYYRKDGTYVAPYLRTAPYPR